MPAQWQKGRRYLLCNSPLPHSVNPCGWSPLCYKEGKDPKNSSEHRKREIGKCCTIFLNIASSLRSLGARKGQYKDHSCSACRAPPLLKAAGSQKTKLYQHFGFNCAGTAHPAFLIRAHDGVGQKEVQWAPNETEESSGHSVCVSFLNFLTSPQQHLWYYVSHFSSYTVSCTTAYNLAHPLAEPKPWGPSGWRTPFNTGSKGIKSRPICSLYSAGCTGFKKCSLTHQDKEGNMLI